MLLPLGTDRPLSRPTRVTFALIAANILVYGAGLALQTQWTSPELFEETQDRFLLDPALMAARPWTLLTYAFLHAGFMHILGNMLFLWVFGPNVEDRFGRIGFLLFYLAGAAVAGLAHALLVPAPVLGASGAVAAVTGAYLVLFPRTLIKVLLVFFIIGVYQIPAAWFIGAQVVWDLLATGSGRSGNVATLAHLGGYAFGIGLSMLLLSTGLLKREMYDLFSLSRHAARRRQFKEMGYNRDRSSSKKAVVHQRRAASSPEPPVVSDELAKDRAEVSERLMAEDLPAAAAAYKALLNRHGSKSHAALLSRRQQYALANHLFASGDHQTAATAYGLFIEGYPKDSEAPVMRLMLGLVNARYLNDPVAAKREIHEAMESLPEGDHRKLARELLEELG